MQLIQKMSFDPWGQRRNLQNYQFIEGDVLAAFDSSTTTRGFTGHEMVDGVGIIHMNGRIYDGKIGRFLQADPFIQAPFDTQSLNRYSYVRNNPLNKTDPSGYFWEAAVAAVYWAIGTYVVTDLLITLGAENLAALASIAGCATGNVDTCAGASFGSNYAFTYDFGKASRAAAISYYSADLYGKAGNVTDTIGNAIANGFVGGIAAELGGGDFGDGFLSAGVSALAKPYIRGIGTDRHSGSRVAVRAILGGTISELTGGKFANGAVSAAMAQLFNEEKTIAQAADERRRDADIKTRKVGKNPRVVKVKSEWVKITSQKLVPGGKIKVPGINHSISTPSPTYLLFERQVQQVEVRDLFEVDYYESNYNYELYSRDTNVDVFDFNKYESFSTTETHSCIGLYSLCGYPSLPKE